MGWDSTGHGVWNAAALLVLAAAIASWRRTPAEWFARAGTGRWWVLLLTIGPHAAFGGWWLPVGPVVWFAYWRPRLRRPTVELPAATAAAPPFGIPGEPLI